MTWLFSVSECSDGLFLHSGDCLNNCPAGTFLSLSRHCVPCYYMCKTCFGPNDYQCITCHEDAVLINSSVYESFCCPQSLLPSMEFTKWYYRACIGLAINISLLIGAGMCLIAQARGCKIRWPWQYLHRSSNNPSSEKAVKYNLTLNFENSDSE